MILIHLSTTPCYLHWRQQTKYYIRFSTTILCRTYFRSISILHKNDFLYKIITNMSIIKGRIDLQFHEKLVNLKTIDISCISFSNDLQFAISVVNHLSDTLKTIYVTEDQPELIKVTLNFFHRGISVYVTHFALEIEAKNGLLMSQIVMNTLKDFEWSVLLNNKLLHLPYTEVESNML